MCAYIGIQIETKICKKVGHSIFSLEKYSHNWGKRLSRLFAKYLIQTNAQTKCTKSTQRDT